MLMLLHRLHRSIPPSVGMEKTRSGYVIPHKQEEKRTGEKGIAWRWGAFPRAVLPILTRQHGYDVWHMERLFRGS